ncbi:hypothetical protein PQR57_11305 [Paraburkholderia dipogonis]|uniref:Uncharacterized protein n=1 Tax=Paraburkholderia dipogonis TaxID=1211383 RepID=A0ABW9APE5_9BURK
MKDAPTLGITATLVSANRTSVVKDAPTLGITVTSNRQTGTYTESADTFRSPVSG